MTFQSRLQLFLLACVISLAGPRLGCAADKNVVTAVMPLVAQAQADAKKWQADAVLLSVLVYAEPDGAVHLLNLGGPGQIDAVFAAFVSTNAEQKREYVLLATGKWIPLKTVPLTRNESLLPIPDKIFDLDEAINMVAANHFRLPPDGKGNYVRATLETHWNAVDRSCEPWWELESIVATDDGLEKSVSRMAAAAVTGYSKLPARTTEHRSKYFIVQETQLGGVLADENRRKYVEVSPDMRHVCWIEGGELNDVGQFAGSDDQTVRVVWDGVAGPMFNRINLAMHPSTTGTIRSLSFSQDGGHLIYSAKRDGRSYVVVDGQPFSVGCAPRDGSNELVWELAFSHDGSRWACVLNRSKYENNELVFMESQMVVDGHNYGDPIRFDLKNATEDERNQALLFPGVTHLVFSPDNRRLAYFAGSPGKEHVVVDGVPGPEFDKIYRPEGYGDSLSTFLPVENLQFTPDSRDVVYVAVQDGKYHAVRNGKPGRAFDRPIDVIAVSPDSQRVAYIDGATGKFSVYVEGGPPTPEVGPGFSAEEFQFSPDGSRYAYVKYADDDFNSPRWVVDGVEGPSFEYVSPPMFSPDGKHVSFIAKKPDAENVIVITDGVETVNEEGFHAGVAEMSAKGEIAYAAKEIGKPELKILMRGKEAVNFGEMFRQYQFSPDGARLAYVLTAEEVADNGVYVDYDLVPDFSFPDIAQMALPFIHLTFDANDRLHYLTIKDDKILRIEVKALAEPQ